MQNPNIFKGITPMVYCYFNRNKTIDKILMKEQINIISKMKISGIAALGLGTEVNKLSFNEKKLIIELLALESKNKPFAITIQGNSLKEYFELIKVAISNQVKWIIIQPLIHKFLEESMVYLNKISVEDIYNQYKQKNKNNSNKKVDFVI